MHYRLIACLLGCSCISAPMAAQTVATKSPIVVPAECTFSEPAQIFTSLKSAPDILSEFERLRVHIADAGEPFIPFDVEDEASKGLPHRQFLRAYQFKDRTIAWYFHGGYARHIHAIELRKLRDSLESEPTLRITGNGLSGPPCKATQAPLDGILDVADR